MKRFFVRGGLGQLSAVGTTVFLAAALSFGCAALVRAQQQVVAAPLRLNPQEAQPPLLVTDERVWAVGQARPVTVLDGGLWEIYWRPNGGAVAFVAGTDRESRSAGSITQKQAREETALSQGRLPDTDQETVLYLYDVASARLRTIRNLPFDAGTDLIASVFWIGDDTIAVRVLEFNNRDAKAGKHEERERLYLLGGKIGKILRAQTVSRELVLHPSPTAPVAVGYVPGAKPGSQIWRAWRGGIESRFALPRGKSGDEMAGFLNSWDKNGNRLLLRLEDDSRVVVSLETKNVVVTPVPVDWGMSQFQGYNYGLSIGSDYRRREPVAQPSNAVITYVGTPRGVGATEAAGITSFVKSVQGDRSEKAISKPEEVLFNLLGRYDLGVSGSGEASIAPDGKAVMYVSSGTVFVRPLIPVAADAVNQTLSIWETRYLNSVCSTVIHALTDAREKTPGAHPTSEADQAALLAGGYDKNLRYYLDRFVWINKNGVVGEVAGKRVRAVLKEKDGAFTIEFLPIVENAVAVAYPKPLSEKQP